MVAAPAKPAAEVKSAVVKAVKETAKKVPEKKKEPVVEPRSTRSKRGGDARPIPEAAVSKPAPSP